MDTAVIFIDIDQLKKQLTTLVEAFPTNTTHAIPIKTHPIRETLRILGEWGFGLEAASFEELELGKSCGVDTENLVFDSPAKTKLELQKCQDFFKNTLVNANGIEELELYPKEPSFRVGLRINPQMKSGSPDMYNVSRNKSKFGEPIENRKKIIEAFEKYSFLEGLHVHAGSDIDEIHKNAKIIKEIWLIAQEIQDIWKAQGIDRRISFIDIGGGATVDLFKQDPPTLSNYAREIERKCPGIFQEYQVITEFGRYVFAHCSWVLSDIAAIKNIASFEQTVIIHIGADMFLREIYQNDSQTHPIRIMSASADRKIGGEVRTDVAGPLCFAGDYLAKDIMLPRLDADDKIIIENCGANSLALWSRHCSRDIPKIVHYSQSNSKYYISSTRKKVSSLF